jgi:hypothetical protein
MREREFIVSFSSHVLDDKDAVSTINTAFQELGYERAAAGNLKQGMEFTKGRKLATYLGLVNWDLVFRKVRVEMINGEAKVLLHYCFSWLTNIGVLTNAAMPELRSLQRVFGARTMKTERLR